MQCYAGQDWKGKLPVPLESWYQYIHWAFNPVRGFAVPRVLPERDWHEASTDKGLLFDRPRIINLLSRDTYDPFWQTTHRLGDRTACGTGGLGIQLAAGCRGDGISNGNTLCMPDSGVSSVFGDLSASVAVNVRNSRLQARNNSCEPKHALNFAVDDRGHPHC